MNELQNFQTNNGVIVQDMTIENRLEIIEEGIRKNYYHCDNGTKEDAIIMWLR